LIVWAKDVDTKKVNGYVVQKGTPGFNVSVIRNKLPVRIVQNCDIDLKEVFTREKLPGAVDFQSVSTKVLAHSRCFICWIAVGICLGVYDNVSNYMQRRSQFQVPIASFQLQQERLVRIQATTNAIFMLVHHLTKMWDEGKASIGVIAATKAWVSERAREVARLGREIMGGNGIITDYYCIKAVNDIEAMYTYEGTYDINVLIAGRELTGIAAFKTK
jgi:acyl-CoA oxidase